MKEEIHSSPFWIKINFKSKQTSTKALRYENKLYHTDHEKANLFANILHTTFSEDINTCS